MSQVNANSIYDASGGQSAKLYGVSMRNGGTAYVNRIINGAMVIDQRNAGASVSIGTGAPYIVDRWNAYTDLLNMTGQRSTTVPSGFTNSLVITVGTGASPTSGQISRLEQRIEGFNVADLGWGSASAQTITLSFWARSSVTGTHSGAVSNQAGNRTYPFTFTISAANTWEYETVTIPGDTSGTWLADNGAGFVVKWNLGTGSTYLGTAGSWAATNYFGATGSVQLSATSGATFYITGVQLEAGSVASPFDRRDYGREFIMCQRYYQKLVEPSLCGYAPTGTAVWRLGGVLPVQMRAAGTVTITGNPPIQSAGATSLSSVGTNYSNNGNSVEFDGTLNASVTVNGSIVKTICSSSSTAINISAEL